MSTPTTCATAQTAQASHQAYLIIMEIAGPIVMASLLTPPLLSHVSHPATTTSMQPLRTTLSTLFRQCAMPAVHLAICRQTPPHHTMALLSVLQSVPLAWPILRLTNPAYLLVQVITIKQLAPIQVSNSYSAWHHHVVHILTYQVHNYNVCLLVRHHISI